MISKHELDALEARTLIFVASSLNKYSVRVYTALDWR